MFTILESPGCTKGCHSLCPCLFLNTLPQAYLRSCDLVIRHQSLPKYSSNPQVHVWPRTDQMPGCELAPPRSSHFTEDASDLSYVNFSQHITQNAVQFNSRELYWNEKQQTAWSWMSSVMYFMGSCGPQESWMLMLAYCNYCMLTLTFMMTLLNL